MMTHEILPRMYIDSAGWCASAVRQCSPNFDARPLEADVSLLVIHNISLPPGRFGGPFVSDLFLNRLDCDADPYFDRLRELRVSAHFLIDRHGALTQFVSTRDRAWHAGASSHGGRVRCNDFSIGVELEGTDDLPFSAVQYERLASLAHALRARHPIMHVAGHEHIAPGRKTDPGPCFDWPLLRRLLDDRDSALPQLAFPPEAY